MLLSRQIQDLDEAAMNCKRWWQDLNARPFSIVGPNTDHDFWLLSFPPQNPGTTVTSYHVIRTLVAAHCHSIPMTVNLPAVLPLTVPSLIPYLSVFANTATIL